MPDRLEKIDLVKKRANVSFQEAKEALEKNDYDVVETLIDLERQGKLKDEAPPSEKKHASYEEKTRKEEEKENPILKSIREFINKLISASFIVKDRNNQQVIKLPFVIAALIVAVTLPFSVVVLVLAVVFRNKLIIGYNDGSTSCINDVIDDLNEEYDKRKENKKTSTPNDEEVKDAEYKIKEEE